jgi:hypothetical protein
MTKNKRVWFKKVRWSYLPVSWQGIVLYILFIIFLTTILQAAIRNQHSVSDVFYAIFPFWVSAAVVMHWIAGNTTK